MPADTRHSAFAGTAVKEGSFEEISLKQYEGKWVLLVFYPMVSTSPVNIAHGLI
jgi:peroxiredoxin